MAAILRPTLDYAHELGVRDGTTSVETFGSDECTGARRLRVKYDQRYDAVKYFCGYSEIETNLVGDPIRLRRLTPMRHPKNEFLVAEKCTRMAGYKVKQGSKQVSAIDGSTTIDFEESDLDIQYQMPTWAVAEDGDVTYEWQRFTAFDGWKPSSDYLMMPGGMLMYVKDGGGAPNTYRIPFNVGKVLPVEECKVTWRQLPFSICDPTNPGPWFRRMFGDPENDEKPWLGTVNSVNLWGGAFRPGSVLFSHLEMILRKSVIGLLYWDAVFTLAYDPNRWNYKWYQDTSTTSPGTYSGWYFVAKNTSVAPESEGSIPDDHSIYNERDLNELWNVASTL